MPTRTFNAIEYSSARWEDMWRDLVPISLTSCHCNGVWSFLFHLLTIELLINTWGIMRRKHEGTKMWGFVLQFSVVKIRVGTFKASQKIPIGHYFELHFAPAIMPCTLSDSVNFGGTEEDTPTYCSCYLYYYLVKKLVARGLNCRKKTRSHVYSGLAANRLSSTGTFHFQSRHPWAWGGRGTNPVICILPSRAGKTGGSAGFEPSTLLPLQGCAYPLSHSPDPTLCTVSHH